MARSKRIRLYKSDREAGKGTPFFSGIALPSGENPYGPLRGCPEWMDDKVYLRPTELPGIVKRRGEHNEPIHVRRDELELMQQIKSEISGLDGKQRILVGKILACRLVCITKDALEYIRSSDGYSMKIRDFAEGALHLVNPFYHYWNKTSSRWMYERMEPRFSISAERVCRRILNHLGWEDCAVGQKVCSNTPIAVNEVVRVNSLEIYELIGLRV